jgi:hypothetical protein
MNPGREVHDRISFGATAFVKCRGAAMSLSRRRAEAGSVDRDETTLSAAHTMCANDRAVSRMTAKGVTRAYKAAEL